MKPGFFPILVLVFLHVAPSACHGYFANGEWTATASDMPAQPRGLPLTLTWSIVPDGTTIHNVANGQSKPSDLIGDFDALIGGGSGAVADRPWFELLEQSFDRWSELSGINFLYEPSDDGVPVGAIPGQLGVRGDIRVGGATIDGNGGGYAQAGFVPNADITIDTSDTLRFGNASDNYFDLRHTLMHEIGHSLGLGHNESFNAHVLMAPFASTAFDGPQFDDLRGAHWLYGDSLEKAAEGGNGSFENATPLGLLTQGVEIRRGLDVPTTATPITPSESDFVSISGSADEDYFSFSIQSSSLLSLSIAPTGRTYSERNSPNQLYSTINTARQNDLTVWLYEAASPGDPVLLTTLNNAGLGEAESLSAFSLSEPGEYYIRVAGNTDEVQFYELLLSADLALTGLAGDYSNDGIVDATDYAVWRDRLGQSLTLPNEVDSPGVVDSADYLTWRGAFGQATPGRQGTPLPEPACWPCLLLLAARRPGRGRRGTHFAKKV